ncbi:MAG: UDP-N-acetylmuramate--L-alanine ligase [Cyanobacteria bacterium RUI128]|nr:UDP-N-acetylmuramate--L-alanine ligase [Cyanobacteria bacterium RUI128]
MSEKYHFIAVGGVGMSGLAKYLLQKGFEVSGSDISDSKYIQQLRDLGGKIFIGHDADNVPDGAIVVVSSAIRESNPELKRAREKGLTVYHRSDLLAEISRSDKCFIGYSGTHGKTTTSGMASYILSMAGENPSYVVGGIIPDLHTNADYNSKGKHFVAELDESDGTIVKYSPNVIVVNNLEADHLDFYKNGLESVLDTFNEFLDKNSGAKVLINVDNSGVIQLKKASSYITYGLKTADYTAQNIVYNHGFTTFDVYHRGDILTSVKIILPGEHNVYNALAVIASINEAGCADIKECAKYLSKFSGMGRRFQKVGEIGSIDIYDDYAHHPTEIKSTLSAMKSFTDKKIIAVFQPHRYTRLKSLWNDFIGALTSADRIIVTDVYAASEDSIDGINSGRFASESGAEYIPGSMEDVARSLLPTLSDNSVVIGLGAGTITNLGNELIKISKNLTKVN